MHNTKKITKEDTWKPSELRRYISEKVHDDGYIRRRDDSERKHRSGESTERRRRDPEEPRRDKDKLRERRHGDSRDRYVEHGKEGSHDQRGDRNKREIRDGRHDRDSERQRMFDDNGGIEDRAADREAMHYRERHRDRHEDRKRERVRDRERDNVEDKNRRREDRDKERRKEDKEHTSERRRHEESRKERRDEVGKQHRERRDQRHRDDYEDKKKDRDVQEKQGDRKHLKQREDREHKEHGRHKEERERRHRESQHHDEKWKHESESRAHRDFKTSGESVRSSRGDKDREEKDKERQKKEAEDADRRHNERKPREEEDIKKKHGVRTKSKRSSSDSHRRDKEEETKDVQVISERRTADVKEGGDAEEPVNHDEDLAEQEYEDDFEDYEEDFEEMDEREDGAEEDAEVDEEKEEVTAQQRKEIEAIQRAMAEENERAGTAQSRQSLSRDAEDLPRRSKDSEQNQIQSSKRGKFINFVAAKQREVNKKVASKQKKRSTELLRLIDLDFSTAFSLLDLPPVNEYEMYIRSFGNANTKQVYVQCNEDNLDRDIQTEEIDTCEKWTQHPSELGGACGDPNFSQEARDKTRSELDFDSKSLTLFLNSASQVMMVLLEEDQAERESLRKPKTQTESLSFSDGRLQLNTKLPFLLGRRISLVHFSQVQRHVMLSVHSPTAKVSAAHLDSSTLICIWNIWEPSRPQRILLYESEVQCCCFSPGKSTLVFAGTSVGSVVLWDLREQASNHYCLKIGEDEWTFRQPTFSTDAVMADSGHFSPVTSVEVVPSTVTGALSSEVPSEEESSRLSFQLASLDESGVLNFWVVLELPKGNEAGSPTDLGLRPGGKVKLLHSSSLHTADRASPRDVVKTRQTLLLKFLPTDSNHFFIGTNLGLVSHGTSHGLKALPKFYRFQEVEERPVDVSSMHFSPFRPHLFLVGCGDGSIRLHSFSTAQPVAEWRNSTAGEPVVSLQWAQTRPTVFCVLDAASKLYIWDLLKNNAQPTLIERISADRATVMSVFGDSGQQSAYSGVALAHESGKIELHYFTGSFTQSNSAEEEKLESLMSKMF